MIPATTGATTRAIGFATAALALLVDQSTKWAVMGPLALRQIGTLPIVPFFKLTWVENHGVSMGFLSPDGWTMRWLLARLASYGLDTPEQQEQAVCWILIGLTSVIVIGVVGWIWRERSRADALALGLVLGGALGNIADRVRDCHVVDFLDLHFGAFHPFLVFNVADAAISIGVLLLVLRALLTRERRDPAENVNA